MSVNRMVGVSLFVIAAALVFAAAALLPRDLELKNHIGALCLIWAGMFWQQGISGCRKDAPAPGQEGER